MKMTKYVSVLAVLLMVGVTQAAYVTLVSEDWESGTDGWVNYGASDPHPALDNTQNTTPGGQWSLRTADNASTNYTNAIDWNFSEETDKSWYVEWSMMDTGSTREYLQLQSYKDGALQQLIAFGTYNGTGGGSNYFARIAVGGTAWTLTDIPRVDNVWHTFRIEQDGATGQLTFSVDGDEWTTSSTAVFGVTKMRLGSGLTNAGHGAFFDDVVFAAVPDPATLALLGMGGLMFVRRRRA